MAWGQRIAASADMRALVSIAREGREAGLTQEAIREGILAAAGARGLTGVRSILPGLSRQITRMSVGKFLRVLVGFVPSQVKRKRMRDVVTELAGVGGWDDWLVGFVVDWEKRGEPGAIFEPFMGRVFVLQVPVDGGSVPVVCMAATAFSDLAGLQEEWLSVCARQFPAETRMNLPTAEEAARFIRLLAEGHKNSEIAWTSLEEKYPEIKVLGRAEYKEEHRRESDRVKKLRGRFEKYVTKITAPVSPDSW